MATVDTVLTTLDSSKTQWYHYKAVIISGMGFFTDAYDLFCVSLITKLLGRIYYHVPGSSKPGVLPPHVAAAINGVALCGTLLGQLFFGLLGDRLGRKKVYGITLFLMALCSIASGLSFGSSPKSVMTTLCFFRFWLGFGIGGDYPLSATIMAEYANKKTRGSFIAAVFAMQGFGILGGGLVGMGISGLFRALYNVPVYSVDPVGSTPPEADYVWRIILMLGALPAVLSYYWRMKMPETARYTALVAKNTEQARKDMEKVLNVEIQTRAAFAGNSKRLVFRGHSLLQPKPLPKRNLQRRRVATAGEIHERLRRSFQDLFLPIPDCIFRHCSWILVHGSSNRQNRPISDPKLGLSLHDGLHVRPGNSVPTLAFEQDGLSDNVWAHVFFANFGPNSTTFIVPAEIFPARLRSTCHGISAAAGKAGAIVGAFGFLYAAQNQDKTKTDAGYPAGIGIRNSLFILGGINLLGFACTFLVPEANGKSLEEMSRDNEDEDQQEQEPRNVEAV
ncbi:hypothetical protein DH2020_047151 [Rehmannia glutinosa]|uniref:Major facilitator superfamily (MFS) profile domain-containing protein n=1 Tax=Rehmannia glutinosa TaxID=99300 RepID=A0ABR0U990_REHGL